jgi:hypothetical protein
MTSNLPCYSLNLASDTNQASKRTYVIYGMPRGGTTMVAGVARLCGLNIGDNLPVNCEDPELNIDLLRQQGASKPVEHIVSAIRRRNSSLDVWGWKFPAAAQYLNEIKPELRNPHLVLVFRDALATATRHVHKPEDIGPQIRRVNDVIIRNWQLAKGWNVPTLLVSYERAMLNPEAFVEQLSEFINNGAAPDIEKIKDYMRAGEYQPAPTASTVTVPNTEGKPHKARASNLAAQLLPPEISLPAAPDQFAIYTMVSNRTVEQFRRLSALMTNFMPNKTLCVIPLDHEMSSVEEAAQGLDWIKFIKPDPRLDEIGRLVCGKEQYRPDVPAWRCFRKLNALLRPAKNILFLDVNSIVVADIAGLLREKVPSFDGFYFGARSMKDRSAVSEELRNFLSVVSPDPDISYNPAFILAKGGLFDVTLARAIARPALRAVLGKAPDQGFLAAYIGLFGLKHGLITSLSPDIASTLSQVELEDRGDNYLRAMNPIERGRIKLVLSYSEKNQTHIPDRVVNFLRGRGITVDLSGASATAPN